VEPARWQQIDRILQATLERPTPERPGFLGQACGEDRELRREVESLLAAHDQQDSFLEPTERIDAAKLLARHWEVVGPPPGISTVGTDAGTTIGPLSPAEDAFGPYVPLRLLGEGGMGTVYLARQEQPIRRDVALKVVKAGMDSRQVMQRFEIERQALAVLDHPHVARVLDAGASERGRQYFVMEYVDGIPITRYCDQHALSTRDRLRLFIPVCQAIEHAHRRGIIHRDVKPSNILVSQVDGKPVPKVIDFGIARATDRFPAESETFTIAGQIVGTPEYMSPEQAGLDGGDIDTGTDVYSLGVVLYELLVGALPVDLSAARKAALAEVLRAVRDTPIPKPTIRISQLGAAAEEIARRRGMDLNQFRRELSGDLHWIVMKATEKDRPRRYESVAEFSADIERYLSHEPVQAGPPSAAYRLRKFVRRNKGPVAAAALLLCSIIGGLIATTGQARLANRERLEAVRDKSEAEKQRARAEQQAVESATQRDAAEVARERAASAERQAQQERNTALLEKERADHETASAKAVNDFLEHDLLSQASPEFQESGPNTRPDPDLKVRTALDRAAASIAGRFDHEPLVEASIRVTIGQAYRALGRYPEAESQYLRALELRRRFQGDQDPETLHSMRQLGLIYNDQGKYPQARLLLENALDGRRRVLGKEHPDTLESMSSLMELYNNQGKYREAELLGTELLELSRRVQGKEHEDTLAVMVTVGGLYRKEGKYAQAELLLKEAAEVRRRKLGEEHPATLTALNNLGTLYAAERKYPEAESALIEVVEIRCRMLGDEHPQTLNSLNNLGALYSGQGKFAQAESVLVQVLSARRRVQGDDHPDTLTAFNNLAMVYQRQGKYTEAEPLATRALEARRRVLGGEHPYTLQAMNNLSTLYRSQGRYAEAEPLLREMLEIQRRTAGAQHPSTTTTMAALGGILLQQQKYADAEAILREALKNHERLPVAWERYLVQSRLGASLASQRKYEEAEPLLLSGYRGMDERTSDTSGDHASDLEQAGSRIVQLYQNWGKADRAAEWESKLLSHH
jgi:non-specific serine/threonine protein kinase/serine/threonine-protein kinase